VALPIYYATGSKWKGFLWSLASGAAEPVGGLIGYGLLRATGGAGGAASPLAFGISFGFVAGMMVRPAPGCAAAGLGPLSAMRAHPLLPF
jgi:ZIP family zinc transporter